MPAIRLNAFTTGIAPAVAPELLQDTGAQIATNCRLHSGDIEPLHAGDPAYTTRVPGAIKSVFRISDEVGSTWLAWANEVDCVKGPITGLSRYPYTGDGEPRVTTHALATQGGGDTYPNQFRVLGLPAPLTAPSVSASGGSGMGVSRYYTYTFYDDWNQESAIAPLSPLLVGKVDDTWAITDMDDAPPNTGGISNVTFVGSLVTVTSAVSHYNRVGEKITIAGVTSVTGVNGTWTLTAVNTSTKTLSFYVVGTPSGTYDNLTDTTDTWARVAPFGPCTKRLYRTSGTTAQFQLVAEGITGSTYSDTLLDDQILGDELISADWTLPPVNLLGLCVHPSGALVGFAGNELCFSEPFQIHAWPESYRLRTDYPIRAVAVYGSNVAVATSGTPYVAYGSEPGQFALQSYNGAYPCLSRRSMVSTLIGAVYASPDGLVQLSDNGAEVITANLYSRAQWQAMSPEWMAGAYAGGSLYYTAQPKDPVTGLPTETKILEFGKAHIEIDVAPTALYTDAQNGRLHYVLGDTVYAHDQPSRRFFYQDWKSKEFYLPEPRMLTAAKVVFDTAIPQAQINAVQAVYDAGYAANAALIATEDVNGSVNAHALNTYEVNGDAMQPLPDLSNSTARVTFNLYADGQLKYSTVVRDSKPFRLPSGYRALRYSVRLTSTCRIKQVELADNPTELKRA